jgi:hypothetical protein
MSAATTLAWLLAENADFGIGAGDRGIAENVDVLHFLGGEVIRVDRAPVALGAAGLHRDLARPLLADDVGDVGLHLLAGLGDDLLGLGIEARHRVVVDLGRQVELDDALVVLVERPP